MIILKKHLRDNFAEAKKFAAQEILKENFAPILPSDEFLRILEEETFAMVGKWSFTISEKVRLELTNAIKDGLPLSVVAGILTNEGIALSTVALERFSRTKLTETMNRGRLEFFEESKIVKGYQYSAILDGRTTSICQGLHGKKFKEGEQPIPPMHFSCRSLLIGITVFEEFKPDSKVGSKSMDKFIDDNIGAGFSKQ